MGERKSLIAQRVQPHTTTKRQHVNCTESTAQADENVYVHTFNLATGRPKVTPQDDLTKVQAKASAQDFEKARLGPSMGLSTLPVPPEERNVVAGARSPGFIRNRNRNFCFSGRSNRWRPDGRMA